MRLHDFARKYILWQSPEARPGEFSERSWHYWHLTLLTLLMHSAGGDEAVKIFFNDPALIALPTLLKRRLVNAVVKSKNLSARR